MEKTIGTLGWFWMIQLCCCLWGHQIPPLSPLDRAARLTSVWSFSTTVELARELGLSSRPIAFGSLQDFKTSAFSNGTEGWMPRGAWHVKKLMI